MSGESCTAESHCSLMENALLLQERQDVSARLTVLIEKVDLLSGDS
jgi:hypothetical protein